MIKRGVASVPERAWCEVKAFLANGKHTMALAAVRRAGGARDAAQGALRALAEADALMGLVRYGDGLRVIARALGRRPVQSDLVARLRITRGRLLWLTGSGARGRAEIRKAAGEATTTLTRARLHEAQGFLAWKEPRLEVARRHLHLARALYARARSPEGIMRVHETEGGLLRDAGRFREALALHDRRERFAAARGLENGVALAKRDRGDLLAYLGRWHEARADLDVAAETFRRLNNPREAIQAGLKRVMADLALGDLVSARASLAGAKDLGGVATIGPRRLAEDLLLLSDLDLALGDAPAAHREASEALRLFTMAKDAEGQCRGHVRRAHALVELERAAEAAREARRALRAAPRARTDLRVLAEIALGRALLRTEREQARLAFERALAHVEKRPGLAPVVALGRALAAGGGLRDPEVRGAIARLEAWGDRRILSYCLRDARLLSGELSPEASVAASGAPLEIPPREATGLPRDSGAAALDAAASLAGEGPWHERWAGAMRAIAPVLPWSRAILVSPQGCSWELRQDRQSPRAPAEDDPARILATGLDGPIFVDLKAQPALRDHPVPALHGLAKAILAPVDSDGSVLYLDTREGQPAHGERELCLLTRLAHLIGAHGPQPGPARSEPPARGFPEIVGRCAGMQRMFRDMERVASSKITVHIHGETGTGKEQVAQAIHRRSRRGSGPFVPVNASTLSDERLGSELFGHVKGAFTGAVASQDGWVAAAEGGTLFIDEVTDLDLRVQAKLLRFLQEREYSRMGELALRRADIRLLTASNASLADRVASGQFREDLMYRLNTSELELPPLRERGHDVILLARHFLRAWAAEESRPVPSLSREAAQALVRFGWPGNVRELASEMRRLVVFATSDSVGAEDLAAHIARARCEETCSLKDAVQRFEREHIRDALARRGQNRTHTAQALGITRQALLGKIQGLGL